MSSLEPSFMFQDSAKIVAQWVDGALTLRGVDGGVHLERAGAAGQPAAEGTRRQKGQRRRLRPVSNAL